MLRQDDENDKLFLVNHSSQNKTGILRADLRVLLDELAVVHKTSFSVEDGKYR
jgi:hypothetical protein